MGMLCYWLLWSHTNGWCGIAGMYHGCVSEQIGCCSWVGGASMSQASGQSVCLQFCLIALVWTLLWSTAGGRTGAGSCSVMRNLYYIKFIQMEVGSNTLLLSSIRWLLTSVEQVWPWWKEWASSSIRRVETSSCIVTLGPSLCLWGPVAAAMHMHTQGVCKQSEPEQLLLYSDLHLGTST